MAKTIQDQLAEVIKMKFPTAEIKKVNKDNFLDIYLPSVHSKRGTHLFFNTAGGAIKLGFYCREVDFNQKILAKNSQIEAYSQGIRPKSNPEFKNVSEALTAAVTFVDSLSGKGKKEQTAPSKQSLKPQKEKPDAPSSKTDELTDFDLTEFDLDGKAIEKSVPETKVPKGKPADTSKSDDTDRCLDDPIAFLTCVQQVRNYYLALSSNSNSYRATYEEILREFTKSAVVPRITDEMLRIAHEDGLLRVETLLLDAMLKAEDTYDKDYLTHNDYVISLGEVVSNLLGYCNTGLFLDTLEFFMYLGDELNEDDSPSGSINVQDRYFPLFLMLKASPEQNIENLEMVLTKGELSRDAANLCQVKSLLLKSSGNFNKLNNEEKLGLILYDFILWDEPDAGLDIKVADITAAKSIFTLVTQNKSLGEKLVGGFDDNASYEIFQFFNVEFNRAGFHTFCLERWKELSSEWNKLKLQLFLEHVKEDFHPNTYINNPVIKDYLKIYEGARVLDLSEGTISTPSRRSEIEGNANQKPNSPKKQKAVPKEKSKEKKGSEMLEKSDKTLHIPSLMHCILFVILQVGWKFDKFTYEEKLDIESTAVAIGEWFDMDEDECLKALNETLVILKKCKTTFDIQEMSKNLTELCLHINSGLSHEEAREDIIRFMNDQANADGKVTKEEETNLNYYSSLIKYGDAFS